MYIAGMLFSPWIKIFTASSSFALPDSLKYALMPHGSPYGCFS